MVVGDVEDLGVAEAGVDHLADRLLLLLTPGAKFAHIGSDRLWTDSRVDWSVYVYGSNVRANLCNVFLYRNCEIKVCAQTLVAWSF